MKDYSLLNSNRNHSMFDLHAEILKDTSIKQQERFMANRDIQRDVGGAPLGATLSSVLPRIGGGILGYQVGKYMNMSTPGKVISTAAGYGVGKLVSEFYQGYKKVVEPSSNNSWAMKRFDK